MPRFEDAIIERWTGSRWERLTEEDVRVERFYADLPIGHLIAIARRMDVNRRPIRCRCGHWYLTTSAGGKRASS